MRTMLILLCWNLFGACVGARSPGTQHPPLSLPEKTPLWLQERLTVPPESVSEEQRLWDRVVRVLSRGVDSQEITAFRADVDVAVRKPSRYNELRMRITYLSPWFLLLERDRGPDYLLGPDGYRDLATGGEPDGDGRDLIDDTLMICKALCTCLSPARLEPVRFSLDPVFESLVPDELVTEMEDLHWVNVGMPGPVQPQTLARFGIHVLLAKVGVDDEALPRAVLVFGWTSMHDAVLLLLRLDYEPILESGLVFPRRIQVHSLLRGDSRRLAPAYDVYVVEIETGIVLGEADFR